MVVQLNSQFPRRHSERLPRNTALTRDLRARFPAEFLGIVCTRYLEDRAQCNSDSRITLGARDASFGSQRPYFESSQHHRSRANRWISVLAEQDMAQLRPTVRICVESFRQRQDFYSRCRRDLLRPSRWEYVLDPVS